MEEEEKGQGEYGRIWQKQQNCAGRVVIGLEEEGQGRALKEMSSVPGPSVKYPVECTQSF